jgi:hypothetical protein
MMYEFLHLKYYVDLKLSFLTLRTSRCNITSKVLEDGVFLLIYITEFCCILVGPVHPNIVQEDGYSILYC